MKVKNLWFYLRACLKTISASCIRLISAAKYSALVKIVPTIFPRASHFSPKIISDSPKETVIKQALRQFLILEKISWILLVLAVLINTSLWYIWLKQSQFNKLILFYATGVLIINTLLALVYSRKAILVEYLFLSASLLVQILSLILLYHTIY